MEIELEELELLALLLRDEVDEASHSCRKPGGCVVVVIGSSAASELLLELLLLDWPYRCIELMPCCISSLPPNVESNSNP